MSIVQAENISKAFAGRPVLSGISFAIDAGDRIGLIGRNGTGKSTLLKLMTDRFPPDSGRLYRADGIQVTMLDQRPLAYDHEGFAILENPRFIRMEERTRVLQEAMQHEEGEALAALVGEYSQLQHQLEAEGAYDYSARLARILAGLGLSEEQMNQAYETLSGGEQMRVSLGRLLLEPGELLLLDEPTNHLDYDGIHWLQDYLSSRQQALVVISHDRWFLDGVCDRIFELENGRLYTYKGGYSQAMEQKQAREERLGLEISRLAGRIQREQEVTQTMLSHRKMKSYHSREKVVKKLKDEMQLLVDQKNPNRRMSFSFLAPEGKKDQDRLLIQAQGLSASFDRLLFRDANLEIKASDRLALLGPNGCGKTTLLRILLGEAEADEGEIRLFGDPVIAFMGQNVEFKDDSQTVYEFLADSFPASETRVRQRLAQFGFREEALVKQLGSLSGGERHRLYLGSILELRPDLLVLDEPTNHLDIESRRLLEEALNDFSGAVLTVSHDRYFIQAAIRGAIGFAGKEIRPFDTYEDWYREHLKAMEDEKARDREEEKPDSPLSAQELRRIRAGRRERLGKMEREIRELEAEQLAFEAADTALHRPDDYKRYAEVLEILDVLYLDYLELEEEMSQAAEA
ncbi:MAG TPA: ABC-F family ATP-binding cassette domain-containing protein [Clostridiaceae bacterium]|nr:ABC-F family ATP-binding cassette domain-containing protein [Clostridiaceae bacterium]